MSDASKRQIDWEAIEIDYRAGVKTLRQIASEHGITHGAVNKRAKEKDWSRDLQAKIKARAEEKVSKALVSSQVSTDTQVREREVVEANATIVADADLLNRKDVLVGLSVVRQQMEEISTLSRPDLAEALEMIGQANFMPDRSGRDPTNELYRYIVSLAGRVKMAKEATGSMGVLIPMQRKILKLDEEADKNKAAVDDLLRKINQSA